MNYFLGMDGGGTRTTAWIADERGRKRGRGEAGPSNPVKAGVGPSQREILRAARQAVRRAGIRPRDVEAVCVGLAGAGNPSIDKRLSRWLHRAIPARKHLLTTDAAIALAAAFGSEPGIVVISGSGSIAYARDERGRVLRAGGWGNLFDDAGSGYEIARRAVAAALQSLDGRGGKTSLRHRICRALELEDITQVIVTPLPQEKLAALFPVVLRAARSGDRVARRLCQEAGRELAELALALVKRLGWKRKAFTIACAGGVLQSSAMIRAALARCVRSFAPSARIVLLRHRPVEGALIMARKLSRSGEPR
jgi:N-acetylglucosamine kinase-like BadF-type ATPase